MLFTFYHFHFRLHISTIHRWSLGFHQCRYSSSNFWPLFICRWRNLPNASRNSEPKNAWISCRSWTSRKTEKRLAGTGRDECCFPTGWNSSGGRRIVCLRFLCFDGFFYSSATRPLLKKPCKNSDSCLKLSTIEKAKEKRKTLLATLDLFSCQKIAWPKTDTELVTMRFSVKTYIYVKKNVLKKSAPAAGFAFDNFKTECFGFVWYRKTILTDVDYSNVLMFESNRVTR